MNSKYKVIKFKKDKFENVDDFISIEEPLEISLRYKNQNNWETSSLSITMRTPGHDKELTVGYLLAEGILNSYDDIDWSQKGFVFEEGKNSHICIHLKNEPSDLDILERSSYMSSSCGVCGKASLESLEILEKLKCVEDEEDERINDFLPSNFFFSLPSILRKNQDIFKKTGGLHGAMLVDFDGNMVTLREDVGRHNAADTLSGIMWPHNPG